VRRLSTLAGGDGKKGTETIEETSVFSTKRGEGSDLARKSANIQETNLLTRVYRKRKKRGVRIGGGPYIRQGKKIIAIVSLGVSVKDEKGWTGRTKTGPPGTY